MKNVFFIAARMVNTFELMCRANRGATVWGRMHSSAGNVPATITKIGPGKWQVKPLIANPLKAKEMHPGFPWSYTDAEAFDWIQKNAYTTQPRA